MKNKNSSPSFTLQKRKLVRSISNWHISLKCYLNTPDYTYNTLAVGYYNFQRVYANKFCCQWVSPIAGNTGLSSGQSLSNFVSLSAWNFIAVVKLTSVKWYATPRNGGHIDVDLRPNQDFLNIEISKSMNITFGVINHSAMPITTYYCLINNCCEHNISIWKEWKKLSPLRSIKYHCQYNIYIYFFFEEFIII